VTALSRGTATGAQPGMTLKTTANFPSISTTAKFALFIYPLRCINRDMKISGHIITAPRTCADATARHPRAAIALRLLLSRL